VDAIGLDVAVVVRKGTMKQGLDTESKLDTYIYIYILLNSELADVRTPTGLTLHVRRMQVNTSFTCPCERKSRPQKLSYACLLSGNALRMIRRSEEEKATNPDWYHSLIKRRSLDKHRSAPLSLLVASIAMLHIIEFNCVAAAPCDKFEMNNRPGQPPPLFFCGTDKFEEVDGDQGYQDCSGEP